MKKNDKEFIEYLQRIDTKKPSDKIIQQIKNFIFSGILKSGDDLLSKRELVKRFAVGTGQIPEAIIMGVLTSLVGWVTLSIIFACKSDVEKLNWKNQ